jgi:O-antigen/teichoic acid export membrane protein
VVETNASIADAVDAAPVPDDDTSASIPAQLGRASTWGFAGRTVLLLANFGSAPFTIRLLGPSAYGLWALVHTIMDWAAPAEAGQAAATTKYGAERYTARDAAGESRVIWSGLCFILMTTGSVAVALALAAHLLLGLLNVHGSLLGAGTWALRVACGMFVLSSLVGAVNTAQQVRLRWKQFTLFNTLSNVLGAVGVPIAIVLFAGGVVTAAVVSLLASVLYFVGLTWDALRLQPALRRPRFSRTTLAQLVSYGWALALAGLASVPLASAERFFLAANASTTAVAYYAVAMTAATTLEVLPQQICSPLMPALARLQADGKQTEHRALYGKTLAGLFLVLAPAAILVAFVARPFLTLWAGPTYGAHGTVLLLVALVGMSANGLAWVPNAYILSAGKTKAFAALQGAELPFYLGAAWVLTARWGAVGAAIVWSARLVVDSVAQFLIVRKSAGLPVLPLSSRRIRSVGAPVLLATVCVAIGMVTHGLLVRSGIAVALVIVYAAIVWWIVLTPKERHGVVKLVTEMLGREIRQRRNRPAHAFR